MPPAQSMNSTPMFSDRILPCLKAPGGNDDAALEPVENGLRCGATGEEFEIGRAHV